MCGELKMIERYTSSLFFVFLRLWAEKRALFNRKLKMVEFGDLLPMGPLIGPNEAP